MEEERRKEGKLNDLEKKERKRKKREKYDYSERET